MDEITKAEFLLGYEEGKIFDILAIDGKVYGKTPIQRDKPKPYRVVWCSI